MRAGDLVHRAPVTLARTASVVAAAVLMERAGVGCLPIVDDGRVVGIVTDRDLVVRGLARREPVDGRVDALMTCDVVGVDASADREAVVAAFRDHLVRRIPVTDGGRVVGVVSIDDVLRDATREELAVLRRVVAQEADHPHHEAALPAPLTVADTGGGRCGGLWGRPGDRLVVHGRMLGSPARDAEILQVRAPYGAPPFLVRWSDTGHVAFVYPGNDAEVHHATDTASR